MSARFLVGDTRRVLATLRDASVDLILTSPPFLGLREYLPDDDPGKPDELGHEANPAEFVDMLLDLTAAWGRVLAPHGSIVVELGDTYSGGEGETIRRKVFAPQDLTDDETGRTAKWARIGDRPRDGRSAPIQNLNGKVQQSGDGWPRAKCAAMIPELYRVALAYGINPLTGAPSPAGRWIVRNKVTWARPNPVAAALGDKFRPATSDLAVATRSSTRYFDLDAVRADAPSANTHPRVASGREGRTDLPSQQRDGNWSQLPAVNETRGAPPYDYVDMIEALLIAAPAGSPRVQARWVRERLDDVLGTCDVWELSPGGYEGAHFAVYPPELCVVPIKSMCPERVCTTCGQPSRRIVEVESVATRNTNGPKSLAGRDERPGAEVRAERVGTTVGWTDCGHGTWRAGVVLDPFAGSGTTMMVAHGHGRDSIGIDLDVRNAELALGRLGMFLEVTDLRTPV